MTPFSDSQASPGVKPGSCRGGHAAVKPGARPDAYRRAAAVLPRLASLMLAGAAFAGCASVGAIKLQGGYLMGSGADQREIRASIAFKLRDPLRRDGKRIVQVDRGPVELTPEAAAAVDQAARTATSAQHLSPAEPDCAGGGK